MSPEELASYKIIYSGLPPPDVPFVVRRRLHIQVVVGLAFQFVPDGAIGLSDGFS